MRHCIVITSFSVHSRCSMGSSKWLLLGGHMWLRTEQLGGTAGPECYNLKIGHGCQIHCNYCEETLLTVPGGCGLGNFSISNLGINYWIHHFAIKIEYHVDYLQTYKSVLGYMNTLRTYFPWFHVKFLRWRQLFLLASFWGFILCWLEYIQTTPKPVILNMKNTTFLCW